jgi:hypothetical protein
MKKGQRYGESHQKASQISTGLLPLVAALAGRKRTACPISGPCAMLGIVLGGPVLPGSRERAGRQSMIVLVTKQLKYPL